ncbi:carboxyvinyl-carboxyphosphonate phosphorylmutase [Prauserella marina]|uniref:2-Methylisocitrate lyase, PEP mutase family n=1 Tax=Prauserella marina TaxID=530584 RepID=A0A222VUN9_9PSEU|nr:isocitrate lyase/phosphoenolpyruvate mutase family protein [Prauserella marina]ASR37625.1 carboxyvinyl-carboxyphosphonate phosphorylmutase [Prauserella marina]PWV75538.1 2-methylisocitrate lyase-like PEP mutase family enzyme [Prauserella marina]SDD32356.1 2-Methylisocitrate lyase, PEP mutase family [Prauserella marina]
MSAGTLRELHVPGKPLLLPNAWDADTATLVEEAGFPVVATSSVAVARTLGYPDGEGTPVGEVFAAVARIARVVSVPVTVDAESGYGLEPAELVERLLESGAVGCNIEDTDHGKGAPREAGEQADLLAGIRQAAGDALVLNARVDMFLHGDERTAFDEAVGRSRRYLDAGADCVYPILAKRADTIAALTEALHPAAVNITYLPDGPGLAELAGLGVARVSLGGGLWHAGRSWLKDRLTALSGGTPPY